MMLLLLLIGRIPSDSLTLYFHIILYVVEFCNFYLTKIRLPIPPRSANPELHLEVIQIKRL